MSGERPTALHEHLLRRGIEAFRQRDTTAAAKILEDAIAQADRAGDQLALMFSSSWLALAIDALPEPVDHQRALELRRRAVAIAQDKAGDEAACNLLPILFADMADSYVVLGLQTEARSAFHSSVEAARRLGTTGALEPSLRRMALFLLNSGRFDESCATWTELLAVQRGANRVAPVTLALFGRSLLLAKRYEEATVCLREAIELGEQRARTKQVGDSNGLRELREWLAQANDALASP